MLVYLVALFEALAYLSAVPVCAAFWVSTEGGLRAGVGLGLFERRFAYRRARSNSKPLAEGKPKDGKRGGMGRGLTLLRRLSIDSVSLRGSLGLGDAAATALACGALQALAASLGARASRVELAIAPDFSGDGLRAELRGMIRARAGQIILAAAKMNQE